MGVSRLDLMHHHNFTSCELLQAETASNKRKSRRPGTPEPHPPRRFPYLPERIVTPEVVPERRRRSVPIVQPERRKRTSPRRPQPLPQAPSPAEPANC